nr:ionotropic receptor 154 [Aedes aegypti]
MNKNSEMKIPGSKIVVLLIIGFVFSIYGFDDSVNHFQWIKRGIEYIQSTAEGSLDVVLLEDPSSGDLIRSIFRQLRRFVSREIIIKIESSKWNIHTRKRIIYVIDGSNLRKLQMSLQQIRRKRSTLSNKSSEFFFILSTTNLTSQHRSLFQVALSCHTFFIHVTDNDLIVHRISPANTADVRHFNVNSSVELIFDDKPDWYSFNVNIYSSATCFPFTIIINGSWCGLDVEAFKAIFDHANMSYHFIRQQPNLDRLVSHRLEEQLLRNGTIHMLTRNFFRGPYGEELLLRDTFGGCLLVPKSQKRNFIYHLVHPFEFDTWIVIAAIILLNLILGLIFPIAFPHNLILILLFGDSVADHEQTRWTRFYCFACTVFLFLLSEAYLAKAIIYMTLTRYAPDMKTLAEFSASGIPLLIPLGGKRVLNNSKLMSQLVSNSVEDPYFYFHLDSNKYAYVLPCILGQQLINRQVKDHYLRHGREGKRMFYLLNEWIERSYGHMTIQYQFLYYARFEQAVRWLGDTGLWDKWLNDMQIKYDKEMQYELRDESDILFLEDLVSVWYVVAGGWTVSALAFVVEVAWNCLKKNCKRWIQRCFSMRFFSFSSKRF